MRCCFYTIFEAGIEFELVYTKTVKKTYTVERVCV